MSDEAAEDAADRSRKALHNRITDAIADAGPAELVQLADAWGKVEHGPDGGTFTRIGNDTTRNTNTNTTTYDQHVTTHEGQVLDRPPTGFGASPTAPGGEPVPQRPDPGEAGGG